MEYLIKKNVMIDYGIKEETNPKLIHTFDNMSIDTNGKTDKENVVILDRDAIVAMVKIFRDSTFDVVYGAHWPHDTLPTTTQLTNLYFGGAGIPAINITTGAQVLLGDGAGMTILKDLEGFIVETNKGALEIAGKVGQKIMIDTSKNNLIDEINKILARLGFIDNELNIIKSIQATHTSEIQALETQQQTNTTDLAQLKPDMVNAKRAIITLNNDKEDKVDFLASQAIQDAVVANLKQDVIANTNAINLSENIDETNHPLTGTHNEATYNVTSHPGDEGPFDHKDKDEFVVFIKDPAQHSGASTSVVVGGTPQVISLAHGGGTSETISVAVDNTGLITVKKVAGNIDVSTLLIDRIIQESNKHGGKVSPADFNLLKSRVALNEVHITNGVTELGKKQSKIDQALKHSSKHVVAAINENTGILDGTQAPGVGVPFMNKTGDNANYNQAGLDLLKGTDLTFSEGTKTATTQQRVLSSKATNQHDIQLNVGDGNDGTNVTILEDNKIRNELSANMLQITDSHGVPLTFLGKESGVNDTSLKLGRSNNLYSLTIKNDGTQDGLFQYDNVTTTNKTTLKKIIDIANDGATKADIDSKTFTYGTLDSRKYTDSHNNFAEFSKFYDRGMGLKVGIDSRHNATFYKDGIRITDGGHLYSVTWHALSKYTTQAWRDIKNEYQHRTWTSKDLGKDVKVVHAGGGVSFGKVVKSKKRNVYAMCGTFCLFDDWFGLKSGFAGTWQIQFQNSKKEIYCYTADKENTDEVLELYIWE